MQNDRTFIGLNLEIPESKIKSILDEVLAVPDEMWHYNTFRGCYMLPIYNAGGKLSENLQGDSMVFTPAGNLCPTMMQTILDDIFPWMEPPGRVTILRTPAGIGLETHFDVCEHEIGTRQEKFRLVLNGNIDKLWFYDENRNKVYVPQHYNAYVMDGGHPHSLDPGSEEKITLCIGAPWTGNPSDEYEKLVQDAPFKLKLKLPETYDAEWLDPFWKK